MVQEITQKKGLSGFIQTIPGWFWGAMTTLVIGLLTYFGQKVVDTKFSRIKTEIEESVKSELGRKNITFQAITNNSVMVRNAKLEQFYIALSSFEERFIETKILYNKFEHVRDTTRYSKEIKVRLEKTYSSENTFDAYDTTILGLSKRLKLLSLYVSDSTTKIISTYLKSAKNNGTLCSEMVSYYTQLKNTKGKSIVMLDTPNFSQKAVMEQILESDRNPTYEKGNEMGYEEQNNNPLYISHKQLFIQYNSVVGALKKELLTPVEIF